MAKVRLWGLQKIKTARSLAVQQLVKLEEDPRQPDFDADPTMVIESAQEHRQVKEYVAGITRWKRWLDFVLANYYNGDYEKLEPLMVQVLRLGAYDLLFLSTPAHAAINETVALAKAGIREGAGGLVNAILRSVDRNRDSLPTPRQKIRANALGVTHSHPNWMIYRWLKKYPNDIEALLEWNNTRPSYTVRVNTAKNSVSDFKKKLEVEEIEWEPAQFLDDYVRIPRLQPLIRQGYLRDGLCAVQDESSGLIVRLLNPQPGETIIDACAAPGGKTMYAASLMQGKGKLLAVDAQAARLKKLDQIVDRYDAAWVERKVADLRELQLSFQADKVLLDAPCSGLGVLAKRADLRWKRKLEDIATVVKLQEELIDAVAKLLKPGGELIYSTCTIAPEENDLQVKKFLMRNEEFEHVEIGDLLPAEVVSKKGFLSTFPPKHQMDGVFGARLRKKTS